MTTHEVDSSAVGSSLDGLVVRTLRISDRRHESRDFTSSADGGSLHPIVRLSRRKPSAKDF